MEDDAHKTQPPRARYLVREIPLQPTLELVNAALERLPLWRRRQAESYRLPTDRLQCATAYLLLCEMLGVHHLSPFAYGEHGKPFLPEMPDLHFSLSHCPRAVMCATDNSPVGCDVEEIPSSLDAQLTDLCFTREEQQSIRESRNPQETFTRLWTRKEAFAKMTGMGLPDDLPRLLHTPEARRAHFHTVAHGEKHYVYTLCQTSCHIL